MLSTNTKGENIMYGGNFQTPSTIKDAERKISGLCPGCALAGRELRGVEKKKALIRQYWALLHRREERV